MTKEIGSRVGPGYKWIALSCTTVGALLSVLNGSTLMIALPEIAHQLRASMEVVIWVIMGYMLAITILVPSIGRVADIFGRKRLYVWGFGIFTLMSFLGGWARTGTELLVARTLSAVGGALMLANSTAIVTDAFPRGELGKALGVNAMVISAASVVGPILGGFLTSMGWRWVFWFNVPLGVLGTVWAGTRLRELVCLPEGQRFDWPGTISFTLGLLAILVGLTFGSMIGWLSFPIVSAMLVGLGLLALFIWIENCVDQPMLDLTLFRNRFLAAAYASNFLNGLARGAVTFLLIFFFQGVKGLSPLQAGIAMTPFALVMMVVGPLSGMLSDRLGSRGLSSAGLAISAIGLLGLTRLQPTTSMAEIVIWMLIMGAGSGLFFSPNTNAIMGAVPAERRGIAAGTRTMMNNAGMLVSIAMTMALTASSVNAQVMQGLFAHTGITVDQAAVGGFVHSLHLAFMISFVISLVAAGISLLRGDMPDTADSNASKPSLEVAHR